MRTVLAHGHIFKNAGTTFDWSLQRNFGDDFLDHRDDQAMREQGTEHVAQLLTANPGLQAFSSHHLCSPLPELPDCLIHRVFFLRHPIRRVASVYAFERQQDAETPGARAAKDKSFRDYVAWRMQPEVAHTIRNYHVHYLAGNHTHRQSSGPGLALFGRAMAAVRSTPLIGIVERYDESMVVMEQQLRDYWPELDLAYVRQNISRGGSDDVLTELGLLAQTLIDENSLDLAIYQLVNRRLDQQIAAVPDFDVRLAEFRDRCGHLL